MTQAMILIMDAILGMRFLGAEGDGAGRNATIKQVFNDQIVLEVDACPCPKHAGGQGIHHVWLAEGFEVMLTLSKTGQTNTIAKLVRDFGQVLGDNTADQILMKISFADKITTKDLSGQIRPDLVWFMNATGALFWQSVLHSPEVGK